jgi:hypothetical protein
MRPLPIPLHTRLMTLTLAAEGEDEYAASGRVLDVRKRGMVPLAGFLNGPGVVHDMELRLTLGRDDLRIRSAALRMRAVPFPSGPGTGGESCRDNEAGAGRIVGIALDGSVAPGLYRAVGGPRGCFHVFTLLRLLAPSVVWAVRHGLARTAGRAFVRTIVVDGFDSEPHLRMRGTLTDVHYASGSPERVAHVFEAEVEAEVTLPDLAVGALEARHRRGTQAWTDDGLAGLPALAGASVARGYSLRIAELIPTTLAPLRELLLMVQPTVFQCMPSLAAGSMRRGRREGPGSAADSCSMWRHDGPLLAAVARESDVGAH